LNKIVRGNRILLNGHFLDFGATSGTELVTLIQLGATLHTITQNITPIRN